MITQFYVSIIFIGIVLMAVSLFLIVLDRKKAYDYAREVKEKEQELSHIINDAEQMIQELNRFSDYVVTRIDEKNQELSLNLKRIDEKICRISNEYPVNADRQDVPVAAGNNEGKRSGVNPYPTVNEFPGNDLVPDSQKRYQDEEGKIELTQPVPKDKLAGLSSKHREIIRLAESGMTQNEIARQLKVGKGEIELVLGLNRQ